MSLDLVFAHVRRNKVVYISALAILIVSLGTVLVLRLTVKQDASSNKDNKTTIQSMADNLKQQGVAAESMNDYEKALNYYQQAKTKYETTGDSNSVVDMKAKIYLMEHK